MVIFFGKNVVDVFRALPSAGLDVADLFLRIVFSFAIGNSDMHLKNFSLIETAEGSGVYQLSDAYDMLPVNVIMPQDQEELALTLNEKSRISAARISLFLQKPAVLTANRQKR